MLKALYKVGCVLGAVAAPFGLSLQLASASERGPSTTAVTSCATRYADAAVIDAVPPDFPPLAREMLASGTTLVKVDLAAGGALVGTSVYASSGHRALDREALAATRWSRFRPEIRDCSAVGGSYLYAVEFAP